MSTSDNSLVKMITEHTQKYVQRIQELETENQALKSQLQTANPTNNDEYRTLKSSYDNLLSRHSELKTAYTEVERENAELSKQLGTARQLVEDHFAKTDKMVFDKQTKYVSPVNHLNPFNPVTLTNLTKSVNKDNSVNSTNSANSSKHVFTPKHSSRLGSINNVHFPSPPLKRKSLDKQFVRALNRVEEDESEDSYSTTESDSLSEVTDSSEDFSFNNDGDCDLCCRKSYESQPRLSHPCVSVRTNAKQSQSPHQLHAQQQKQQSRQAQLAQQTHVKQQQQNSDHDDMFDSINIIKKLLGVDLGNTNQHNDSTFFKKFLKIDGDDQEQSNQQQAQKPSNQQNQTTQQNQQTKTNPDVELLHTLLNAFGNATH